VRQMIRASTLWIGKSERENNEKKQTHKFKRTRVTCTIYPPAPSKLLYLSVFLVTCLDDCVAVASRFFLVAHCCSAPSVGERRLRAVDRAVSCLECVHVCAGVLHSPPSIIVAAFSPCVSARHPCRRQLYISLIVYIAKYYCN